MAINKLALIRYKTIDDCLRNNMRKWTLEDLIDKVSEVLEQTEGILNGVSKRTIQADLQIMRSDKLGYNAPIEVRERKYYYYTDPNYSIVHSPINEKDMEKLKEAIGLLKQFNTFQHLGEMGELITRLENNLYHSTQHTGNYIQIEGNARLKGLAFIAPLYQYIKQQKVLSITYQSFRAEEPHTAYYFPYLLKEFRNRWFLICLPLKGDQLLNLALDRMIHIEPTDKYKYRPYKGIDFDRYYSDLIGVTKGANDRPQKVILHIDKKNAPYLLTKPLHSSQQVIKEDDTGLRVRLDVILNFELERDLLAFGEQIEVISPRFLKTRIQKRLAKALSHYNKLGTDTKDASL